jgi:hypothetical protein
MAGEQGLKHRVRSIFGARQAQRQRAAFLPQGRNYKRHTDVVEKLPAIDYLSICRHPKRNRDAGG